MYMYKFTRLCRAAHDWVAELNLHRQIRNSVKYDRQRWLDNQLAGGNWAAVRSLRKKQANRPSNIRGAGGEIVDEDVRGNTLADYFEHIQWKVSFAELVPSGAEQLGNTLPINVDMFTMDELRAALKALAAGKAAGNDNVPPELWKVLLASNAALVKFLELCRACWIEKDIPSQWRVASVVLLFKKGT